LHAFLAVEYWFQAAFLETLYAVLASFFDLVKADQAALTALFLSIVLDIVHAAVKAELLTVSADVIALE
jgi:hypothetical protein